MKYVLAIKREYWESKDISAALKELEGMSFTVLGSQTGRRTIVVSEVEGIDKAMKDKIGSYCIVELANNYRF